ncbi:PBP1A family penicillin-binding protein [Candidatus Poribacteria bacterium]|nr:PBP1A family penicillin-binding protein [Candidatus Poribacteria bacterium]
MNRTIFQIILTVFLIGFIGVLALIFIGMGFAGGMVFASWKDIQDVDLGQLEYQQTDIWKQHLEVYSSICIVQKGDSIDFLLEKLIRLKYIELQQKFTKPSEAGQYLTDLNPSRKTGKIWIFLQGFHYPRGDRPASQVEIDVRDGAIVNIRNDKGVEIPSFDLQPELIGEAYNKAGEAREIVLFAQMHENENLLKAFLAAEDKRFYQHWGIDIQGIIRAFIRNLRDGNLVGGSLHGASTITQQLTKNIYLSGEQRYLRKIKEALLAFRIEAHFSKDEILEKYLNLINLGRYGSRDVLGVQEAAKSYFGKPVWELEIHECATLAGIPKSPPAYSPIRRPEKSKTRRNLILQLMWTAEYITESEYEKGINQPLVIEVPKSLKSKEAPHFLDYVHQQLAEMPLLKDQLYNQGLKVYTTIDMSMQKVAEKAVVEHLRSLDKGFRNLPKYELNLKNRNGINPITNYPQSALIAIEPMTGRIKAMVGGRDYFLPRWFRDRGINGNFYNRAVQAKRQPGSAFKPIVFAALFEKPSLANPATVVRDEAWFPEGWSGDRWSPRNYKGIYYGDMTLRRALEKSINVATARLMWETPKGQDGLPEGVNRTIALAKRLGIESHLDPYPTLALGASVVTPLELTSAYAVFANRGVRTKPTSIQYVENRYGELLIENQVQSEKVLDEDVAYLITRLMEGVIKNGTGRNARRTWKLKRPAAGKTGTTNDFTDTWFVGYVRNLVVGVWVGFDDPQKKTGKPGATGALPIWAKFMVDGARGPVEEFPVPSGIELRAIDKDTGLLKYDGKCPKDRIILEAFLVGDEPKMLCNVHQ